MIVRPRKPTPKHVKTYRETSYPPPESPPIRSVHSASAWRRARVVVHRACAVCQLVLRQRRVHSARAQRVAAAAGRRAVPQARPPGDERHAQGRGVQDRDPHQRPPVDAGPEHRRAGASGGRPSGATRRPGAPRVVPPVPHQPRVRARAGAAAPRHPPQARHKVQRHGAANKVHARWLF